jgi:hypothetical protein
MTHYYGYNIDLKTRDGKVAYFIYIQGEATPLYQSGYEYPSENTAYDSACSRIDTLFY